MTTTAQAAAAQAPAAGRRVTPTGRLILPADADRADWLHARTFGIGSSDVPAILGVADKRTPTHVYLDKTSDVPDDAGEAAFWGTVHEEPVARVWAMRNRSVIRRVGLVAHADHPHRMTTLDRRVTECPLAEDERIPCALEVKTRSAFKSAQWHAGPPDDVLAQMLHQISVCGYEHMHYAVLIGGNEYHQGTVRADQFADVTADVEAAVDRFWFDHVRANVPPPLTGDGEALVDLYRRTHPDRSGTVDIDRQGDALDALLDYEQARIEEKAAEKRKTAAKARMIRHLGNAQAALIGGERAYSLEPTSGRPAIDLEQLAERWPDAYAACVTAKPGERLDISKTYRHKEGS